MLPQVFTGIKIFELTEAITGPMIARSLADYGATVIRVETLHHVDVLRTMAPYKDHKPGLNRGGFFAMYNCNKYDVTLNLNHPEAAPIINKLVDWCDIFVESFRPGVVARCGLSYPALQAIKPDIIMISTSMQGQTGPHSKHPGYGAQLVSLTGFSRLTGWPDRIPAQPFSAYTDAIGPRIGAGALVAALIQRLRTGRGQYFDLSQYEAGIQFIAPLLMDYSANQRIANRDGNRCDYAAPHAVYPCQNPDGYCAIAVFTDSDWHSLCRVMDNPPWTQEERFITLLNRKKNEEALDQLISQWTLQFPADKVMQLLQSAGVPAGVVKTAAEVCNDPQLNHRQHFKTLEHLEIGKHQYHEQAFRLSRTPSNLRSASPCQGQHNEYVYTHLLGLTDAEFARLLAEGVFE
jgi:benzylsuccinate CoA-transferase BbsF subunit